MGRREPKHNYMDELIGGKVLCSGQRMASNEVVTGYYVSDNYRGVGLIKSIDTGEVVAVDILTVKKTHIACDYGGNLKED